MLWRTASRSHSHQDSAGTAGLPVIGASGSGRAGAIWAASVAIAPWAREVSAAKEMTSGSAMRRVSGSGPRISASIGLCFGALSRGRSTVAGAHLPNSIGKSPLRVDFSRSASEQ